MASPKTKSRPRPGEVWLGCPPYLLIARIVEVDYRRDPPVVSYELHDEDGSMLERVNHATLDRGWWQSFQPMRRRYG
jgi:hypothetical protein